MVTLTTGENSYYRARYYDPAIGRFTSEDPTKFDGGINFYAYVTNDPVSSTDPSGLRPRRRRPRKPKCDAIIPADPSTALLAQLVFAEGNGTPVDDLAIASVVVNRANYGNPGQFGQGIAGVVHHGFQATGNALFNSVGTQAKVCGLNQANCQRYKNAALAATAAQAPGGTNTDALFYFDISIELPAYLRNGLREGFIVPAPIDGQTGQGSNYSGWGTYGNPHVFFNYTDYSH